MRAVRAVLAIFLAGVAWGQTGEEQKARYARLAYDDIVAINVFLDLGVTAEQAAKLAAPLEALAQRLAVLAKRAADARKAAVPALQARRAALLSGQPMDEKLYAQLGKLYGTLAELDQARGDARAAAYREVLAGLGPEQQARVTETTAETPEATAEVARRQAETNERYQAVFNQIGMLMRDARETPDPRRFEAFAPQHVSRAVLAVTGLAPDHRLLPRLNVMFLDGIRRIYYMKPIDFARLGPAICGELTEAAIYAIDHADQPAATVAAGPTVSADRLARAVAYERSAILLKELAKGGPEKPAKE